MAHAATTGAGFAAAKGHKGAVRRAFDRIVAARELEAKRHINGFLASLDDATLAEYGYDRDDIKGSSTASFPY